MKNQKTAIVTGASAGIGESVVRHFLDSGYRTISIARRKCPIESPDVVSLEADLSDRQSVADVCKVLPDYEPTTIVHNAGVVRSDLLEDVELGTVDELVELYLSSTIQLTQACLPAMKAAAFGRIVLVSSRAAVGLGTRTAYSATKSGQFGLTRTWALELGQYGITVNLIAPGPVSTKMFTDVVPQESAKEKALIQTLPMRRIGQPADIARAVMYFADEQNNFVTGQTLFVCGGASVGFLQI